MQSPAAKYPKLSDCTAFNYDELLQLRWKARLEQVELQKRTVAYPSSKEQSVKGVPTYNRRQGRCPEPIRLENLNSFNNIDLKSYRGLL
uniref:Uncharacterized protein n=1 Tax=Steinernema glaseri TaxID=37863 RepID=A0A1I7ZWT0_9BILA